MLGFVGSTDFQSEPIENPEVDRFRSERAANAADQQQRTETMEHIFAGAWNIALLGVYVSFWLVAARLLIRGIQPLIKS